MNMLTVPTSLDTSFSVSEAFLRYPSQEYTFSCFTGVDAVL